LVQPPRHCRPWQSFLFTPFGISHHKFPALLPNFPRQLAEEKEAEYQFLEGKLVLNHIFSANNFNNAKH